MTSKYLVTVLAVLCFVFTSVAQVVNPGGGVYAISDIPGLVPALDATLTNTVKGADTGTTTGAVTKVGRQAVVQFPTIPSMLYITTNSVHGTVYIDPSGITPINFLMSFPNVPFITFTPVGSNINELLTFVLRTVDTNGATFSVISSGSIVTNPAYQIDWQANDGAGLSWAGTSLATLGGATNVYLNNGSQGMNSFYFPVGHGAGKWLISDASGYGSWQDKTIANLTDGADVFKKDGSVAATGNFDMGGKEVRNVTKVQVTTGAGAGKILTSDANGYGTWGPAASWSPAVSPLNMNGYAISGIGGLNVASGSSIFNGIASFNGAMYANNDAYFAHPVELYAGAHLHSVSTIVHGRTGGSYGAPDFRVNGYSRFDGVADFRGTIQANSIIYAQQGIIAYPNTAFGYGGKIGAMTAPDGTHIASEGNLYAGHASYLAAVVPATPSIGNVIAESGIYGATLAISGSKTFCIQHPRDACKLLRHASIESPRVELLYRGKVALKGGKATINLNTYYGLIPHTLDDMLTNLTANAYNNAGWTPVRCRVVDNVTFEIQALTPWCKNEVEWIAIGTRCDEGVKDYRMEANK